jgi:hypothetical protein
MRSPPNRWGHVGSCERRAGRGRSRTQGRTGASLALATPSIIRRLPRLTILSATLRSSQEHNTRLTPSNTLVRASQDLLGDVINRCWEDHLSSR